MVRQRPFKPKIVGSNPTAPTMETFYITSNSDDINMIVYLGDDTDLNIKVTSEGIILDLYEGDVLKATEGMTFDEWVEWMINRRAYEDQQR